MIIFDSMKQTCHGIKFIGSGTKRAENIVRSGKFLA